MAKTSAGLLMFRIRSERVEVLLVHPGGPYFRDKDAGVWTIPKGEPNSEEPLLDAARREFEEETGNRPEEPFLPLGGVKQNGGKTVHAWAFQGDCDPSAIRSNLFRMQWPPRSGREMEFPEIDRAEFFPLNVAAEKLNPAQQPLLKALQNQLKLH